MNPDVRWSLAAEAQEYRDTLALEGRLQGDAGFRRHWAESEAAFDAYEQKLSEAIAASKAAAWRRALALDQDVVRRMQAVGTATTQILSHVQRQLLTVASHEWSDARFAQDGSRLVVNGTTWTTDWAEAENQGWEVLRLAEGNAAATLVERAAARKLPVGHVLFDCGRLRVLGWPSIADVERLTGQAGWLRVSRLTLGTRAEASVPRQVIIGVAVTDAGSVLDVETVERLFSVPGSERLKPAGKPPRARLEELARVQQESHLAAARVQNAEWVEQERVRLKALATEQAAVRAEKIRALEIEEGKAEQDLQHSRELTQDARAEKQRRIAELVGRRLELKIRASEQELEVHRRMTQELSRVEESLVITPLHEELFTLRWEVEASSPGSIS